MDAFWDLTKQCLIDWGLPGLFIAAMLSGSVVPFSSELVLIALVHLGLSPILCIVSATLGNTFGGMSCYYLGRLGKAEWLTTCLRLKPAKIDKVRLFLQGKGSYMAFFTFLPSLGTIIALVLGMMRSNVLITFLSMLTGKLIRYVVLLYIFEGLWKTVVK